MYSLSIFFLLISGTLVAARQEVNINTMNLKSFTNLLVKPAERETFQQYYHQVRAREKLKKNKLDAEKRFTQKIEAGKAALSVERPALFTFSQKKEINPHKREKLYLRYAIYNEFLKSRAQMNNAFFTRAQSYVKDVSTKVVNWFGGLRRSKVV